MNILLDSKEHVKIGDFGLATRQFFSKIAKKAAEEGGTTSEGGGTGGGGGGKSSDLTMVSRYNQVNMRLLIEQNVDTFEHYEYC